MVRSKRPFRLPVVLSRNEVRAVLDRMSGVYALLATLLYGTGMRIMECVCLRVKDVDFDRGEIWVRKGKGNKDRVTALPSAVVTALKQHLQQRRVLFEDDLRKGMASVFMPEALARKYLNAASEWAWQYIS